MKIDIYVTGDPRLVNRNKVRVYQLVRTTKAGYKKVFEGTLGEAVYWYPYRRSEPLAPYIRRKPTEADFLEFAKKFKVKGQPLSVRCRDMEPGTYTELFANGPYHIFRKVLLQW